MRTKRVDWIDFNPKAIIAGVKYLNIPKNCYHFVTDQEMMLKAP